MSTKYSISKQMAVALQIPLKDCKKITEKFLNLIKKNSKTKMVKISGFGSFYYANTAKRIGRNPKTMESYIINPVRKITFKASNKSKEILN